MKSGANITTKTVPCQAFSGGFTFRLLALWFQLDFVALSVFGPPLERSSQTTVPPLSTDGIVGISSRHRIGHTEMDFHAISVPEPKDTVRCLTGGAAFRWKAIDDQWFVMTSSGWDRQPHCTIHLEDLHALQKKVPRDSAVGYRGCDKDCHYFSLPGGESFTIPRAAWDVMALPRSLGWCIPLVFEAARLVIPDSTWAAHIDLTTLQWTVNQ